MYRVKPVDLSNRALLIRAAHRLYRLFRDAKRRRIAQVVVNSPPAPPVDENLPYTVHTLLCKRDLSMGICAAKALNLAANLALPWVFHDDGSLRTEDFSLLRRHFPGARIVTRTEADQRASEVLRDFPRCNAWRNRHVLMLRLLDVPQWAGGTRIWFVDSDQLFFQRPNEILALLDKPLGMNFFSRDITDSYVLDSDKIKEITGVDIYKRVNAGLGVVNRADMRIELIEQWLGQLEPFFNERTIYHRLEQTLLAMLASVSSQGIAHLPPSYDVALDKPVEHSVCKHYVGRIRHGFELEGLAYLLDDLDFIRRWQQFVNEKTGA